MAHRSAKSDGASLAARWSFLLLLLMGLARPFPAAAQGDCMPVYRACLSGCQGGGGRSGPSNARSCATACMQARASCSDDAGPSVSRLSSNGAIPPDAALTRPLTSEEVNRQVQAMVFAEREYAAQALQGSRIPACQGSPMDALARGYRPEDCLFARPAEQAQRRTGLSDLRMSFLRPLGQSLDLELQSLDSDGVGQARLLHALRNKYRLLLDQREGGGVQVGQARPQPELRPLQEFAGGAEQRLYAAERRVYSDPAVRRAFAEGDLQASELNLTKHELRVWSYDIQTILLARQARSATGAATVFMDRAVDLAQSDRERLQAGSFASWSEPTVNEMGLAVLRGFFEASPTRLFSGVPTGPYESRMQAFHQGWAMRIAHVAKTGCRRQNGGFSCGMRLWMHGFIDSELDADMVASFGASGRLFDIVGRTHPVLQASNGDIVTALFVPGPEGWSVADLNTAWQMPKDLEVFWGEMGSGRSTGGVSPDAFATDRAISDLQREKREAEEEYRDRIEAEQRSRMDSQCGVGRIC